MGDDLSWIMPKDKPLEEVIQELNLYFHRFSWVQEDMNNWELRTPVYAGYVKRNGYILTSISLNLDGSFNVDSGGYFEDGSLWIYIRPHRNITDDTVNIWEKAIAIVIDETSDLFQDGNLQISINSS